MKWSTPPRIKVYEALGAVADRRVKVHGNTATVTSSSGKKEYQVVYDPDAHAITSNDNGSYWQGCLGYPAIAFLMEKDLLAYDVRVAKLLKGIAWKDMNQTHKNDYEQVEKEILGALDKGERDVVSQEIERVMGEIQKLGLNRLNSKEKPPKGY